MSWEGSGFLLASFLLVKNFFGSFLLYARGMNPPERKNPIQTPPPEASVGLSVQVAEFGLPRTASESPKPEFAKTVIEHQPGTIEWAEAKLLYFIEQGDDIKLNSITSGEFLEIERVILQQKTAEKYLILMRMEFFYKA